MRLLSSSLVHLTSILSDLEYHDGTTLGSRLNVTRSAIWKSIKKLEEHGIKIYSVKSKGYALKDSLILLDQEFISKKIDNPNITIEVLEEIDSTNQYLKRNLINRRICIAEKHLKGKGRLGRNWHSPFAQNIYMSYVYNFKKDASQLNGLSLVVSIAMIYAIREIEALKHIMLKWPNDGIFDSKKIMGNIIEMQSENYGESTAIIGMGINVNMLECDEGNINQSWTSLRKITGKYIDRNLLCVALIHNLNMCLEQFDKYGLSYFITKWNELDYLYNKSIRIDEGNIVGIAKGIDNNGNLLLETAGGEVKSFPAGETSICK